MQTDCGPTISSDPISLTQQPNCRSIRDRQARYLLFAGIWVSRGRCPGTHQVRNRWNPTNGTCRGLKRSNTQGQHKHEPAHCQAGLPFTMCVVSLRHSLKYRPLNPQEQPNPPRSDADSAPISQTTAPDAHGYEQPPRHPLCQPRLCWNRIRSWTSNSPSSDMPSPDRTASTVHRHESRSQTRGRPHDCQPTGTPQHPPKHHP